MTCACPRRAASPDLVVTARLACEPFNSPLPEALRSKGVTPQDWGCVLDAGNKIENRVRVCRALCIAALLTCKIVNVLLYNSSDPDANNPLCGEDGAETTIFCAAPVRPALALAFLSAVLLSAELIRRRMYPSAAEQIATMLCDKGVGVEYVAYLCTSGFAFDPEARDLENCRGGKQRRPSFLRCCGGRSSSHDLEASGADDATVAATPPLSLKRSTSKASILSGGEEPRCFLSTSFMPLAGGLELKRCDALEEGDEVQSMFDRSLTVSWVKLHSTRQRNLVTLVAEDDIPAITVTPSHRICVGLLSSRSVVKRASELGEGDVVLSRRGGEAHLVRLRKVINFVDTVSIVEVKFKPDGPVAVYDPPDRAILTKGQAEIRRGGRKRKGETSSGAAGSSGSGAEPESTKASSAWASTEDDALRNVGASSMERSFDMPQVPAESAARGPPSDGGHWDIESDVSAAVTEERWPEYSPPSPPFPRPAWC